MLKNLVVHNISSKSITMLLYIKEVYAELWSELKRFHIRQSANGWRIARKRFQMTGRQNADNRKADTDDRKAGRR